MAIAPYSDIWTVSRHNEAALSALHPSLFFHTREPLDQILRDGKFALLHALARYAHSKGLGIQVVKASPISHDLADKTPHHLHIFMEDTPHYGSNILHAVPSYLRGFWYFDELASRNNSTHRLRVFKPGPLDQAYADQFLENLQERFIIANFSKFPQSDRRSGLIPGALVFFAQDFNTPRHYPNYLSADQIIRAAIATKGSLALYIKPHPNQKPDERKILEKFANPDNGVYISDASIHDLLHACAVCLTLTSAVGFESFLHKKPVILGGQTDFAQNAITLTNPAKMREAIAAATSQSWPYAKFLVWFLKHNCIEDKAIELPKVLALIHRKGFTFADDVGRGFY
jgi:hypothetical protein